MVRIFFTFLMWFISSFSWCQSLDSLIAQKIVTDTTHEFKPDSIIFSIWSSENNDWKKSWKEEFIYNESNLKIFQNKYLWNTNHWEASTEKKYFYDNHLIFEIQTNSWDNYLYDWVPNSLLSFEHNSFDKIVKQTDFKWDYSNYQWENDSVIAYFYTTSGYIDYYFISIWSEIFQTWENNSKTSFNYTDSMINRQIFSTWDFDILDWNDRKINYFEYDSNQLIALEYQTVINSFQTQWVNNWKKEYQWNTRKKITDITEWDWDHLESVWIQTYQTSYTYDPFQNRTSETLKYYDYSYFDWINNFRTEYSYNFNQKLTETTLYFWNYSQWNPLYKYNYYFPDYTNLTDIKALEVYLYPNPASEILWLSVKNPIPGTISVDLFDFSGRNIESFQLPFENKSFSLPLTKFEDGVYILRIQSGKFFAHKKLIVKN